MLGSTLPSLTIPVTREASRHFVKASLSKPGKMTSQPLEPITETANRAWCAFFGLESAAVIIGNALVIAAFIASESLRKRKTYLLLISLAVADFLIGAMVIPMYVHVIGGQVTQWWKLDSNVIHTQRSIEIFTSFASIFFLVVIALERVYAALSPIYHDNLKPVGYYIVISIVWIFSAIIGILSYLRERHVGEANNVHIFYMLMVLISLSMFTIIISYIIVVVSLFRSRKFTNEFERKMAATLLMLTVIFVVTWLPFKVINYVIFLKPGTMLDCGPDMGCVYQALYATKFLHFLNSVVNPIVYALRVKDFREGVRRILCCCCGTTGPASSKAVREKGFDNPAVSMQSLDTVVPSMFL